MKVKLHELIEYMEVIMIRHTSVDISPGTCYGQSDVPVRDTFPQEAEQTKRNLKSYEPFDAVYCSPLTRTRMLAEYCGYPEPIFDDRIKEINFGDWEMQPPEKIYPPTSEWLENHMNIPTPNGEDFPVFYRRVAGFLDELRTKDFRRVAVFAHGGVLLCAGLYVGMFGEKEAWNNLVGFGGIQRIEL